MRAIWHCRSRSGMHNMKKLCGHWNVYIGWKIPKRVDLRCKKCGTRHQFRPGRTTTRGRKSQLQWLPFPNDTSIWILDLEAERRRAQAEGRRMYHGHQTSIDPFDAQGFQSALDILHESPREKIRRHLQKVVSPVGGESIPKLEKPKLSWWRRLIGFFRRHRRV